MELFVLVSALVITSCAPVDDVTESVVTTERNSDRGRHTNTETSVQGDAREENIEKNPIQEWFENLSKDTSANAQNALNSFKDWISKLSPNNISGSQNLPTVYLGSFQLFKMPMPQFGDVIKGMGDLATVAQAFNKVTGGLPLLSQTG